ncbi:MAG: GNAT family N-acetyltransferase [Flavobacteriaceae bacterium]|nr:GNAT family N-acetyltransferase [Flavobacteriaceae bacterium]
MKIEKCTVFDYNQILENIVGFWGSDRTLCLHHPLFIHEFGNTAYVVKEKDNVIAYLFGFLSQTSSTAYVHLIGVHKSKQNMGIGTKLYNNFISYAKLNDCNKLKAITSPTNILSINFHKKMGMHLLGNKNNNGVEVIKNYSGNGQDRVVFLMNI